MSVEEWQREYDLIYQELNDYLAQELLESTKHDENFHIQKYEELNQQEVEHLTEMYNNPDNTNFYVCAVCKGYVHRLQNQPSRIVCERRGCIDIDLRIDQFRLEDVMNMVMKVLMDHREACNERGPEVCNVERSVKLKINALSEVGMCCEDDP